MSQRHERRRRTLNDESPWGDSDDADDAATGDGSSRDDAGLRAYGVGSRDDRQRRVHDLFPSRYRTIALVVVAGLAATGLIELLHAWAGSLAEVLSASEASSLDLNTARDVSRWFSAMLLGVASLAAMSVYALRRHRLDDYHGRYRVWIWTALGCLLASLVETSTTAALAQGLCRRAAEACGLSAAVAWPATVTAALTILAVRLIIEIKRCRLALAAALTAVAAFVLAAAVDHGWVTQVVDAAQMPLERGSCLAGYVLTLATFLLYGRHVNREIAGLIAVAPARPRRQKAKKSKAATTPQLRVDPAQKPAPHQRDDESDDASPRASASRPTATGGLADRVLSRSERRRSRRDSKAA